MSQIPVPLEGLTQVQEPGSAGGEARGGRGVGKGAVALSGQTPNNAAMERMFAIAVHDSDDLFLWIRLRRAGRTDIYYVFPTGREGDLDWKKWDPHGSWHSDGQVHHKSFDQKMFQEKRQKPDSQFKGTRQLILRGIALDEPRAFGVRCDPGQFSEVMTIPVGILSKKHYETYTSIDVCEPGVKPILMGGQEKILRQRVFSDAIPHITVTVYQWP